MINLKSRVDRTLLLTLVFYCSLILNILLGWLLAKLNTQFLTVSDYGKYSFFLIAVYFSRIFFSFGVSESSSRLIAVNDSDSEQKNLIGVGLIWILFFIVPYGFFFFLSPDLFDHFFQVNIGAINKYFSFAVGLILIHAYLNLALRGHGRIILLSFNTIAPRTFYIILLIIIINYNTFTLTHTLEMFFIGLMFSILLVVIIVKPNFQDFKSKSQKLWTEIKSYGIHLYISNIWHEILFHSDKFIISYYLDDKAMAYYALGYMITYPLSHFSTSLSTTLFNKFISQKKIRSRDLKVNSIYVFVTVSVIILLRKIIIIHLFSEKYLATIDLILPLAIAFGLSGLSKPFNMFLMAHGYGQVVRNISILVSSLHIVLNIVFVPKFGITGAAWIATLIYGLDLLLFYLFYHRMVRIADSQHRIS